MPFSQILYPLLINSLLCLATPVSTPPSIWVSSEEFQKFFAELTASFPERFSGPLHVGSTVESRPLSVHCLGMTCFPMELVDDGAAPGVFLTALLHGREPMGALVNAHFVHDLLTRGSRGESEALALLSARRVVLWPNGNPDAYELNLQSPSANMARKNRKGSCNNGRYSDVGVDLNRNFDFSWSVDNEGSSPSPCAEDFRGSAPFSEPESTALRDFLLAGAG